MIPPAQYLPKQHRLKILLIPLLFGFVPVLLLWAHLNWPADLVEALHLVGVLMGAIGLSFLTLSALCTLRHPHLEHLTRGLHNLYRLHHQAGIWAIVLIVGHVAFIASAYNLSSPTPDAYLFKLWEQPSELVLGWVALVLLCAVAVTASIIDRGSRIWRFIHLLSLPAYLFALYHFHFLTASTGVTRILLYALFLTGFCAGLLRSFKYAFSYRYRVKSTEHFGNNVISMTLVPEGKPLHYDDSHPSMCLHPSTQRVGIEVAMNFIHLLSPPRRVERFWS